MKRSFIYQDEKSHKFWNIEISGTDLTVTFGKAGTAGQTQTKSFASDAECKKAADKLIAEKTKKGYAEETSGVETTTSKQTTTDTVSKPTVETTAPDDAAAFPPTHLFNDLLALAAYVKENPNGGELETVKVSKGNIREMENAAGFSLPSKYLNFALTNGSIFYSKDDFIVATYCYNKDGVNGNSLYEFLSFYQTYQRVSFQIIHDERKYLQPCWWMLGMIINGNSQWLFVANAALNVVSLHFPKPLRELSETEYNAALEPVLNAKTRETLSDFMSTSAYTTALEGIEQMSVLFGPTPQELETANAEFEETKNTQEAETQAFLKKYNIQKLTYEDVIEKLGVEQLFDYWDGEDHDGIGEDYESEADNYEGTEIYYHEGDLTVDGDLNIPHVYVYLFVVNGNLTVNGKISNSMPYYVRGNTTVDYLSLSAFQKTIGKETVRYVALAWGDDDETTHQMPERHIDAPYFFSWFYGMNCFTFEPHTVITVVTDSTNDIGTDNLMLEWHAYAYAFRPELYYGIDEENHNMLTVSTDRFYEHLKKGLSPFLDDVTPEGIRLVKEGVKLKKEGDAGAAYQTFREAIAKSPGYYLAYYHAGKCLLDAKAYAQAKEVFAKGIPLTPESLLYEYSCMEQGAHCAVRIGEYETAVDWATQAVQKNKKANFAYRVLGEAHILLNEPDSAKRYLERSLEVKQIFSANWLMGLIYHLQGDSKKADTYYKASVKNNAKAQPYSKHTDLKYIYGDNVTVDWDKNPPKRVVKDQNYWNNFFAEFLAKYGPDMYKKTGIWPETWLTARINTIPQQFRTAAMLDDLLNHKTHNEYDVSGEVILLFDAKLLNHELILKAVTRPDPCRRHNIPAEFFTEQIIEAHPDGIDLQYVTGALLTYDRCFRAVTQSAYNYQHVPEQFRDERMNIALIAGGALNDSNDRKLAKQYFANEYIVQAIDLGIDVILRIPAQRVDQEVYQHAVNKYGKDPVWPFIVEQHDRDRWRYGSISDVEHMGQRVRKYGIDIFDHVNIEAVDRHSFAYYKKHLGHLPEFKAKADAYGWTERSTISDRYSEETEFDTSIFSKVWACFWDEEFIRKAFIPAEGSIHAEHLFNLPEKYRTQKVCEYAINHSSYNFPYVPKELVTQEMVEKVCSMDYGTALEYVPVAMRSATACQAAVAKSEDNIKFVPIALRKAPILLSVILRNVSLTRYIPHDRYAEVFETFYTRYKNRFQEDFLLVHWGLGLIFRKDYDGARKKLEAVDKIKEPYSSSMHHAPYYIGWTYFLEGDIAKADEYWRKAQTVLKEEDVDDDDQIKTAYKDFELPTVPEAYDFSKEIFDKQMGEATLLIQNKNYTAALEVVTTAEKQLNDAQYSEIVLWAYVWDYKRYVLYEAGFKEECYACCRHTITEINKVTLWPYLEEYNPARAALRAAHNNLAYHCYQIATDLKGIKEGLEHIKTTMKTVAPIEDKEVLNVFYETHALLLHKATTFDAAYQKDLDKVVARIKKLKLREEGILTDELLSKINL